MSQVGQVGQVGHREGGEEFRGWHFLSLKSRAIYFIWCWSFVANADLDVHIDDDKRRYNSFC